MLDSEKEVNMNTMAYEGIMPDGRHFSELSEEEQTEFVLKQKVQQEEASAYISKMVSEGKPLLDAMLAEKYQILQKEFDTDLNSKLNRVLQTLYPKGVAFNKYKEMITIVMSIANAYSKVIKK